MLTFKQLLNEIALNKGVFAIDKADLTILKDFLTVMKIIDSKDISKTTLDKLSKFSHYMFVKPIIKQISEYISNSEMLDMYSNKFKQDFNQIKSELNRIQQQFNTSNVLDSESINKLHTKYIVDLSNIKSKISIPNISFNKGTGFFSLSGTRKDSYLQTFDDKDKEELYNLDLSGNTIYYNTFSIDASDSWEKIAYFGHTLVTTPYTKLIDNTEDFILNMYATSGTYKRMYKLVKDYQASNDKRYIEELKKLTTQIPELIQELQEKYPVGYLLYRGIDGTYYENEEQRYVSTSNSKLTAKNFAMRKGHLDSQRKNEYGQLITYKITEPNAVVIDTKYFGVMYSEDDVVLDTQKSKIVDIVEV